MNKLILIVLTLTLVLSLAACGAAQPAETPAATNAAAAEETTGAAETTQAADPAELAKSCIDKPLSELIALIGEPESSDYAPSCLIEGAEDGNWYYDGFTVYTLRTADGETVEYVE